MDFVVGYMREALSDRVVMVRKNKPDWQKGLLNGVGGKVDHFMPGPGRLETPLEAMVREFKEETGIETNQDEWRMVMYMQDHRDFYADDPGGEVGTVYWFCATRRFLPKLPPRVLDSGEELLTVNMYEILGRRDVLATVRWVMPMAFLDPTLQVIGSDDHVLARAAGQTPLIPINLAVKIGPVGSGAGPIGPTGHPGICGAACMPSKLERDGVVADGCEGRTRPKDWFAAGWAKDAFAEGGLPPAEERPVRVVVGSTPGTVTSKGFVPDSFEDVVAPRCREMDKAGGNPFEDTIAIGDMVQNRTGTERGIVHGSAHDGKMLWVNSVVHPLKWVTMYADDVVCLSSPDRRLYTPHSRDVGMIAEPAGAPDAEWVEKGGNDPSDLLFFANYCGQEVRLRDVKHDGSVYFKAENYGGLTPDGYIRLQCQRIAGGMDNMDTASGAGAQEHFGGAIVAPVNEREYR